MKDLILTQQVFHGVKINAVKNILTNKIVYRSVNIIDCLDFMYASSIAKDAPTYH